MARFTWGASPRRSEVTPITLPAALTSAAPPKAALYGVTMKARSSMYSQAAANGRTAWMRLGVATRSPASDTPTVPVVSPTATVVEFPRGRGRPRAAPLEPGHADPDLEIEPDEAGGHLAAVTERDLDARGVEEDIAHGQHVALVGVEDDAAAPALDAERGRRRPAARDLHADAHHRRLDAADLGGQRGHLAGIEAAVRVAGRGRRRENQAQQGDGSPGDRRARHDGYLAVYCAW